MPNKPKAKLLVLYFILIFAVGIILRLFVLPLVWPSASEITDSALVILTLFGVMLIVMYYLKTQGSQKQIRTLFVLSVGLPVGFAIYAVISIIVRTVTNTVSQGWSEFFIILALKITLVIYKRNHFRIKEILIYLFTL